MEIEAQNLIFSPAALKRCHQHQLDIRNAYFQGEGQDRLTLCVRQLPGGLPDVPADARILGRVPVYGAEDAGRKFWKRLHSKLLAGRLQGQLCHGGTLFVC